MSLSLAGVAFGHGDHSVPLAHREAHLLPLPDQAIALVALAIAFARLEADSGVAPLWTFVITMASGLVAGTVVSPGGMNIARAIPLIILGLILIDPWDKSKGYSRSAIATAAIAMGLSCGATQVQGVGALAPGGFLISIAVMLAVLAAAFWKRFNRPWFRVALKIAGSWMAAIGTILLGAALR